MASGTRSQENNSGGKCLILGKISEKHVESLQELK
jgi:hypothetical protein